MKEDRFKKITENLYKAKGLSIYIRKEMSNPACWTIDMSETYADFEDLFFLYYPKTHYKIKELEKAKNDLIKFFNKEWNEYYINTYNMSNSIKNFISV